MQTHEAHPHERLPRLLEHLEVGIAVVGPGTEALWFNDAAIDLLGLTREQLLGRSAFDPLWNIVHEDGTPFAPEDHPSARAIATRQPVRGIVAGVLRPSKGDRRWLLCNAVPQIGPDGKVQEVICSFSDITEQKAAEAGLATANTSLQKQARLLDLAHDAIIVREADGTIYYWNGGAANKYGWNKEDAQGKQIHELLKTRFPQPIEQIERTLAAEGYWEGELVQTKRNGVEITVHSRQVLEQRAGGGLPRVLEINRDITQQKAGERKLREREEMLHKLSGHLLQSQDEERRRISQELHDTASQILTALLTRLHMVSKSTHSLSHPAQRALSESLGLAESVANFIRTFASGLHPPILDEKGLGAALHWYADGIDPRGGIHADIEMPADQPRLPRQVERSFYRIAQESIARLRMIYGPAKVNIRLTSTPSAVALEIWGTAGDASASSLTHQQAAASQLDFGAAGMRERMKQFGGSLEISSSPSGTLIRAVLPLGRPASARVGIPP